MEYKVVFGQFHKTQNENDHSQLTFSCCEIRSRVTIKTPERRVFIVNFERISHFFLVFLLLTLSK